MTRLTIPNGAPVYSWLVRGTDVEIVIAGTDGPVILETGLVTLGHLLAAGERTMQQARGLVEPAETERARCRLVGTRP